MSVGTPDLLLDEAELGAVDLVGSGEIVARSPWELFFNRFREDKFALAGIAFLIYMAWKLALDSGELDAYATLKKPSMSQGAAMQWLNPKAWLASVAGMVMVSALAASYFARCSLVRLNEARSACISGLSLPPGPRMVLPSGDGGAASTATEVKTRIMLRANDGIFMICRG